MPKKIVWTEKAALDFEYIIDFLLKKWTTKIANDFIDNIDNRLILISKYPTLYPTINANRDLHKCVVNSHNSIIYLNSKHKIEVVRVLSNKKEPI
jgi:plasmid stabilization system protein ParE